MKTIKQILIGGMVGLGVVLGFNASAQTILHDDFAGTPNPSTPYVVTAAGNFENTITSAAGYTYVPYIYLNNDQQEWHIGIDSGGLSFSTSNAGPVSYGGISFTFNVPSWTVGSVTGEDIQNLVVTFNLNSTAGTGIRLYANGNWWQSNRFDATAPSTGGANGAFIMDGSTLSLADANAIAADFNARNTNLVKIEMALTFPSSGPFEFSFNGLNVSLVPEPATGFLLGVGALLLTGCAYLRRR